MINALLIDKHDNVCVVTKDIKKSEKVKFEKEGEYSELEASEDIPVYYKVAVHDIKKGDVVLKYNNPIGVATEDIPVGMVVHTHNLVSMA